MEKAEMLELVDTIVDANNCDKAFIITMMQQIQKEHRYLPEDALVHLAKRLDISESKVYGVATFYENFSMEPKGKNVIKICDGTACHVRKSIPILEAIRRELGLTEKKHTTEDMIFTVETVSCLGACGLAPVITVNGDVYPKMTPDAAVAIIREIKEATKNEDK